MPQTTIEVRNAINRNIAPSLKRIADAANQGAVAVNNLQKSVNSLNANVAASSQARLAASTRTSTRHLGTFNNRLRTNNATLGASVIQLKETGQAMRALFSGILLAGSVGPVLASVDAYANFANKIKQTTDGQDQFNEAQRQLVAIARRTGAPLKTLATGFQRIDSALSNIGGSQQESIDIIETLVKAFATGGLTTSEMASALTQLTQSFNSGILAGEEFKALAEALPSVMNALAKSMGVPVAELRELREKGKITVNDLRKAFADMQSDVAAKFELLDDTVGRSIEKLKTAFIIGFSEFDTQSGLSKSIINIIQLMTANVPTIIVLLKGLGAALAGAFATHATRGLISLSRGLTTLPGLILTSVAALSAFGDSARVTSENGTTLNDSLKGLLKSFSELQDLDLQDAFKIEFFETGAEDSITALDSFKILVDGLIDKFDRLRTSVYKAVAGVAAFGVASSRGKGFEDFSPLYESAYGLLEERDEAYKRTRLRNTEQIKNERINAENAVINAAIANENALRAEIEKTAQAKKDDLADQKKSFDSLRSKNAMVGAVTNPYSDVFTDKFKKDTIGKAIDQEQALQKIYQHNLDLFKQVQKAKQDAANQAMFPIGELETFKSKLMELPSASKQAMEKMRDEMSNLPKIKLEFDIAKLSKIMPAEDLQKLADNFNSIADTIPKKLEDFKPIDPDAVRKNIESSLVHFGTFETEASDSLNYVTDAVEAMHNPIIGIGDATVTSAGKVVEQTGVMGKAFKELADKINGVSFDGFDQGVSSKLEKMQDLIDATRGIKKAGPPTRLQPALPDSSKMFEGIGASSLVENLGDVKSSAVGTVVAIKDLSDSLDNLYFPSNEVSKSSTNLRNLESGVSSLDQTLRGIGSNADQIEIIEESTSRLYQNLNRPIQTPNIESKPVEEYRGHLQRMKDDLDQFQSTPSIQFFPVAPLLETIESVKGLQESTESTSTTIRDAGSSLSGTFRGAQLSIETMGKALSTSTQSIDQAGTGIDKIKTAVEDLQQTTNTPIELTMPTQSAVEFNSSLQSINASLSSLEQQSTITLPLPPVRPIDETKSAFQNLGRQIENLRQQSANPVTISLPNREVQTFRQGLFDIKTELQGMQTVDETLQFPTPPVQPIQDATEAMRSTTSQTEALKTSMNEAKFVIDNVNTSGSTTGTNLSIGFQQANQNVSVFGLSLNTVHQLLSSFPSIVVPSPFTSDTIGSVQLMGQALSGIEYSLISIVSNVLQAVTSLGSFREAAAQMKELQKSMTPQENKVESYFGTMQQGISATSTATTALQGNVSSVTPAVGAVSSGANTMGGAFQTAKGQTQSASLQMVQYLKQVQQAAEAAARAVASIGSFGGGFSGGGGSNLTGFASGGYTGHGSPNSVAGFVHNREFVMPPDSTRAYRPILEAMRSGSKIPAASGSGGSRGVNVTVKNYGGGQVETRQISESEIELIVHKAMPKAMAGQLNNPNSRVSKSLRQNTTAGVRR